MLSFTGMSIFSAVHCSKVMPSHEHRATLPGKKNGGVHAGPQDQASSAQAVQHAARSGVLTEALLGHATKEMALARIPELVKLSLLFSSCHNAGPILAMVNRRISR